MFCSIFKKIKYIIYEFVKLFQLIKHLISDIIKLLQCMLYDFYYGFKQVIKAETFEQK